MCIVAQEWSWFCIRLPALAPDKGRLIISRRLRGVLLRQGWIEQGLQGPIQR